MIAWKDKSRGKHLKLWQFSNKGMHPSHKLKMVTFLCILELVLFYLYTAVILIGMKWDAIHV